MTLIAIRHGQIDVNKGLMLTGFALIWIVAGITLGTTFIPQHEDVFRGSAGFVTILIGFGFFIKGIKGTRQKRNKINDEKSHQNRKNTFSNAPKYRQRFIYLGVAIMAFQVGLFGIGGGMGYAVFLMVCLSFPVFKATGTAMFMTFGSTFFAAFIIFFQIPAGAFAHPDVAFLMPIMIGMSMIGTYIGARIAYSLTESKINILIGSIVIFAGLLASAQKYVLQVLTF